MKTKILMTVAISLMAVNSWATNATLYKSPYCGCCRGYVNYLKSNGLDVESVDVHDMDTVKQSMQVPQGQESCHTMQIEGYVVEGHVPVEAVSKLLAERPDIKGISLAGMPIGTPGMPGPQGEDWRVMAIQNNGELTEFMTFRK